MSSAVAPEPANEEVDIQCKPANGKQADGTRESKVVPGGLFAFKDPQSIKDQVKDALRKKEPYSVFMYYKEDGIFPQIAKSSIFENTTLAVIAINAVYIAIDTDWNKEEPLTPTNTMDLTNSGVFFQFMEHSFCVYFTFEWICRFMSFQRKKDGLKDGWFIFDSLLVFMMVMETWVLLIVMAAAGSDGGPPIGGTSILRLFRLLRLSRLMRMLRSLPELMILIKGLVTAMKSVSYVMGLLVLITYVFAIAFTQLSAGSETIGDLFFANVSHSMYSLLIYATFLDDLSAFTDALRFEKPELLPIVLIFIALSSLTVMNMLIGVLCEVVSAVAEKERDDIRTEMLSLAMRDIVGICEDVDDNQDLKISYKEFCEILRKPEGLSALEDVGVDPAGIVDFAELFFFDDGQELHLSFEEFMEVILDLRESNGATVKDMLNLWKKIKTSTNKEIVETRKMVDSLGMRTDASMKSLDAQNERITNQLSTALEQLRSVTNKIS